MARCGDIDSSIRLIDPFGAHNRANSRHQRTCSPCPKRGCTISNEPARYSERAQLPAHKLLERAGLSSSYTGGPRFVPIRTTRSRSTSRTSHGVSSGLLTGTVGYSRKRHSVKMPRWGTIRKTRTQTFKWMYRGTEFKWGANPLSSLPPNS
ncbi:hypothetical protein AG1IA_00124 [Rhizoctonia solani AG-1 IA]|uniref:Uncharacterized protein n=1 Tax=Thanatephorus cucumeris (strain AG1-IA) TaxID=983506 RepID=L8X9V3_THACA|nr:hypothetical protein AG1IA_00124 [Rhizoctonia solani AG-1 IA]